MCKIDGAVLLDDNNLGIIDVSIDGVISFTRSEKPENLVFKLLIRIRCSEAIGVLLGSS
jgi:hypothetical protein